MTTLEVNKLGFFNKFLKGSKNVTIQDKKTLFKIFLFSSLIVGAQLYFSTKSRKYFLKSLLVVMFLLAIATSGGSFIIWKNYKE
jgi:hypothetical protein